MDTHEVNCLQVLELLGVKDSACSASPGAGSGEHIFPSAPQPVAGKRDGDGSGDCTVVAMEAFLDHYCGRIKGCGIA